MREVTNTDILAQLNGGNQSTPAGMRPVENEQILQQLNAGSQRSVTQNSPQPQAQQNTQAEQPSVYDRAMSGLLDQQSPFAPRARPEEEKNWGMTEKIAGSLMDFAPFLMGGAGITRFGANALSKFPATAEGMAAFAVKHPRLAKYIPQSISGAISGAGYGAATAEEGDRASSAGLQGAIGAVLPAAGGALVDPLLRYGAKQYAQSAIPAFTKKATEKLNDLLPTSEYAKKLSDRFLGASKENSKNWTAAEKIAQDLDGLRGTSQFNQEPYQKYIQGYGDKINQLEPALKAPYAQPIELAKQSSEMAPESFMGAMGLRKNINQTMKDYINKTGNGMTPTSQESKKFLTGLKDNLKNETIDAQKGIVPEEALNNFKNNWETANKSHQDLQQFYKSPQKMTGVEEEKGNTIKQALKASLPKSMGGQDLPVDPAIMSKYVPSLTPQGAQGVQGLKQLAKIMGSKKDAVEAAKAHIFRRQIENGANTVDVAAKYAAMSPSQRKYLFGNSDEGKMLDAINRTRKAFNREPEKTSEGMGIGRHIASMGPAALLGTGTAMASGDSWDKAIPYGIASGLAAGGLRSLAGRTATPGSVNRAINFGKNGMTNFGRNSNALTQSYMNTPPPRRKDSR